MKRCFSLIFSLILSLGLPLASRAANTTFLASEANWDDPLAWSANQAPTSGDWAVIGDNHTALVPTGVTGNFDILYTGTLESNGHLRISGGLLSGNHAIIGSVESGTSSVIVDSGTWANNNIILGGDGVTTLTINGGLVSATASITPGGRDGPAIINLNGGILSVGFFYSLHTGTANLNGGTLQARRDEADFFRGTTVINVASTSTIDTQHYGVGINKTLAGAGGIIKAGSGTLSLTGIHTYQGETRINEGTLHVATDASIGTTGADVVIQNGTLEVNGGVVSGSNITVAESNGSVGSIAISSGTVKYRDTLTVGGSGTASLVVKGGVLTSDIPEPYPFASTTVSIGDRSTGHGEVLVEDFGSRWINEGHLIIGGESSGNTLTITDQALVQTIGLSFNGGGSEDNFIHLRDGYFALMGERILSLENLITAGHIQLWDGAEWTSAPLSLFEITYYADTGAGEAAALTDTGYSGLRNYTVVTASAVPEPGTWALIGLAAGYFGVRCLRRRVRS